MLARKEDRQQLNALLSKFNVNEAYIDNNDMIRRFFWSHTLSSKSEKRVEAFLDSLAITNWLLSGTSTPLHVSGQIFSGEHEVRQSSLSYICAKLVDSVHIGAQNPQTRARTPTVILHWFCGQHTNTQTESHPHEMLKIFISQFVRQLLSQGIGYTSTTLDTLGQDPTLPQLFDVLEELAWSLPRGSILFCVLDNVPDDEDPQRQDEMADVLTILRILKNLDYSTTKRVIKILTTGPLESSLASRFFNRAEWLDMMMSEHEPPNGRLTALP